MSKSLISFSLMFFVTVTQFVMQPAARAEGATNAWEARGSNSVQSVKYEWFDASRNRKVPVKIYYPKTAGQAFPVIIFSHGLGGSRDGYEYLGQHWASHGYVVVHLQHIGSDSGIWSDKPPAERMQAMRDAVMVPENAINRPLDVTFAIDQLEQVNKRDGELKGMLDLAHIGLAGHSFGAFTTLASAGEVFISPHGARISRVEPRIKAAIAMSAPVPVTNDKYDTEFSQIKIPLFHMTGTLDDSPIGETKAADRRIPFDKMTASEEYLVTFTGGDHMIFSGRANAFRNGKDPMFQNLIRTGSVAFWDAYLKGDGAAKTWLAGGGYKAMLGENGVFEKKSPAKDEAK